MWKKKGPVSQSDATLLVSVEDLINIALGPADVNVVNFKLLQTLLHIMARQLRMLETQVDIRMGDYTPSKDKKKTKKGRQSIEGSPPKVHIKEPNEEKTKQTEGKEKDKAAAKDKEKSDKVALKEKEKAAKLESKEQKKGDKDSESKEREKAKKSDTKDKAKAEREDAKEQEKADKAKSEDKEKAETGAEKDKEKGEIGAEKDKEKGETGAVKDKEKMSTKDREKTEKGKDKQNDKGISITEKANVLIVGKGPSIRTGSRTRVGSIEVVTVSQFELLEAAVKELTKKAGPLPLPALPDNEKLRSDLAHGRASLSDTMLAMQVKSRVHAAEAAIGRMAELLTYLAAAGAIPEDVADRLLAMRLEMDAIAEGKGEDGSRTSADGTAEGTGGAAGGGALTSGKSIGPVSHPELDDTVRNLREELVANMNSQTSKAAGAASAAAVAAKSIANKMDIALKLNDNLESLLAMVNDYNVQMSRLDDGLTTQVKSFEEQMGVMQHDMNLGLAQLLAANNNAESIAVADLTERYTSLVTELDITVHEHQALAASQKHLQDDLQSLLECVEMLREQKADREEVLDGLRDKADNSRLAGLLSETDFALSRFELERRLDLCYDKFKKQEQVWMGAIRDLKTISQSKAEIMQLLATRDDAQQQLRDIQDKLQKLAIILGDPKAAMLTRQLSKGARCGACQIPALQEPVDIGYGKPFPLPAMRLPPPAEEKPCIPEWKPPQPPDAREHTCHRWVGGSHTLLSESVVREQAAPLQSQGPPTKRYTGYGSDGRLYMMQEELQPCMECNMISTQTEMIAKEDEKQPEGAIQEDGAGDTGNQKIIILEFPAESLD